MDSYKSPVKKGAEFEEYVASLYEDLGFNVEKNINLNGQQIDLILSKNIIGMGMQKVIIECKYRTQGSISNQDVIDLAAIVRTVGEQNGISKATLVTNVSFSQDATAVAHSTGGRVTLLNIRELENEIFDLTSTYRSYISLYDRSEIKNYYISLAGTMHSLSKSTNSIEVDDVEKDILSWIDRGQAKSLAIIGDYGAGKTTLMERIKYILARRYIDGTSSIKPLFIRLKDYHDHPSIEELISFSLRRDLQLSMPLSKFWVAVDRGQFVILLDGFDEMESEVNREVRKRNFMLLAPLLKTHSSAIITCRPSYFVSIEEYNLLVTDLMKDKAIGRKNGKCELVQYSQDTIHAKLFGKYTSFPRIQQIQSSEFTTITLSVLSDAQIDLYLSRHSNGFIEKCNCTWSDVKQFLLKVYDLKDLMKRPILLSMITDTILTGQISITSEDFNIGPSTLYELYTNLHLEIDWHKGASRRYLSMNERLLYSEAIAMAMYESEKLEIVFSDLMAIVLKYKDTMGSLDSRVVKEDSIVASDIQVTTFLTLSASGRFRFMHRSFMEFFVARHMKLMLESNKYLNKFETMVPKEILYFLSSYAHSEPKFMNHVRQIIERSYKMENTSITRRNMTAIILLGVPYTRSLAIIDADIQFLNLNKKHLSACRFERSKLSDVNYDECQIDNAVFTECVFSQVSFKNTLFKGCQFAGKLAGVQFTNCKWINSKISLTGTNISGTDSLFDKCKIEFDGSIDFRSSKFLDSEIYLKAGTSANFKLRDSSFSRSLLVCDLCEVDDEIALGRAVEVRFRGSVISDTIIFGMLVTPVEFREVKFHNSFGIFFGRGFDSDEMVFIPKSHHGAIIVSEKFLTAEDNARTEWSAQILKLSLSVFDEKNHSELKTWLSNALSVV